MAWRTRKGSEGKVQCVKIIARNSDNVAVADWRRKWRKKYRLPEAQPRVSNDNNFLPSIANTIPRFPTNSSISGKEKLSRLLNDSLTRNATSNNLHRYIQANTHDDAIFTKIYTVDRKCTSKLLILYS